MTLKSVPGSEALAALLGERTLNLRQLLSRSHRGMNICISRKFASYGHGKIRPAHLSILANMNLGKTSFQDLIERAQITSSGVDELVVELVDLGYVSLLESTDMMSNAVDLTDVGWELMLLSFNIQSELEADFRERLRPNDIDDLRRILSAVFPHDIT